MKGLSYLILISELSSIGIFRLNVFTRTNVSGFVNVTGILMYRVYGFVKRLHGIRIPKIVYTAL